MTRPQNIYNFQLHHSEDEETHYLLPKGRIGLSVFLNRIIFSFLCLAFLNSFHFLYWNPLYHKIFIYGKIVDVSKYSTFLIWKIFYESISPVVISIFIVIQSAKRLHDVDKSAFYLLFPIYNLSLLILPGTIGKNNYGLDPSPKKNVIYYDELEHEALVQPPKRTSKEILKLCLTFILIIFVTNQFTQYSFYKNNNSISQINSIMKNRINLIDSISKRDYINLGIPSTIKYPDQFFQPINKIFPNKRINIIFKSSIEELNRAIFEHSIDIILAPSDDIASIKNELLVSNAFNAKTNLKKLCFLIPPENIYFLKLLNSNILFYN